MFAQFPILIAPVDEIATLVMPLRGTLTATEDARDVYTTGNFVVEAPVGSKLLAMHEGQARVIGYVGQIVSPTHAKLETPSPVTVLNATGHVHTYKSGFVKGAKNFLSPQNAKPLLIADIFRRVKVVEEYARNASVLLPYTIREGETPEMVSYQFYGTPFYHWVILLVNNIVNVHTEWPLSEAQLLNKLLDQYAIKQTGTITVTEGSPVVTGVNTTFATEITTMNQDLLTPQRFVLGQVESVASQTSLTLTRPATRDYAGRFFRCHKDAVYHYIDPVTRYVHDFDPSLVAQGSIIPQTIHEYEIGQNEAKRFVKILRPDFVAEFVRLFYVSLTSAI